MTPERFEEIKRISTGLGSIGLLAGIIIELIAEVTRWQDRARLYHNHIVILQEDCEALVMQQDSEAIVQ